MNNLNFNVYTLNENLEEQEFIVQFNESSDLQNFYEPNQYSTQSHNQQFITTPWKPSKKLDKLHRTF